VNIKEELKHAQPETNENSLTKLELAELPLHALNLRKPVSLDHPGGVLEAEEAGNGTAAQGGVRGVPIAPAELALHKRLWAGLVYK
jgi:hypothetical protein